MLIFNTPLAMAQDLTSTELLQRALRDADRLRVRSGGACHRNIDEEKTLIDIANAEQARAFVQQIDVIDNREQWFHCMCCGNPTIELYQGDKLLAALAFHHGRSLRWVAGKWPGDAKLTPDSALYLREFLAANGAPGAKEEFEEMEARSQEWAKNEARWKAAMPEAIKPYWKQSGDPLAKPVKPEIIISKLAQDIPDRNEQILTLLHWLGSGDGPWSGYPAYESLAQELLLQYTTQDILAAVDGVDLTPTQTDGLARLFGGWDFSQKRPNDRQLIPAGLKTRLLAHVQQSDDEDNRSRALRAFGGG